MGSIKLARYEAEEGDLPNLCMRCGARATVRRSCSFAWHPPWVWLMTPLVLVPLVGRVVAHGFIKRMGTHILLCEQHKRHLAVRGPIIWCSAVGLVLVGMGLLAVMGKAIGLVMMLATWLVSALVIQNTAIHATEITDWSITLTRISPVFIETLRKHRQRRPGSQPA